MLGLCDPSNLRFEYSFYPPRSDALFSNYFEDLLSLLLGRIVHTQCIDIARGMFCASVCWAHKWDVQKRMSQHKACYQQDYSVDSSTPNLTSLCRVHQGMVAPRIWNLRYVAGYSASFTATQRCLRFSSCSFTSSTIFDRWRRPKTVYHFCNA